MRAKSVLVLLLAGFCALASLQAQAAPAVEQAAPALTTTTLDGKPFDIAALKGKVVVVNFWATWCPPCRDEMPALEAVYRHYHSQGLEVLAISADRPRARGDVDQVMHYFTFPAAILGTLTKNDFGTPNGIPVTYVIGKDGNIANILTPDIAPLTEAGLGDTVKALLEAKEDTPAPAKTDAKP